MKPEPTPISQVYVVCRESYDFGQVVVGVAVSLDKAKEVAEAQAKQPLKFEDVGYHFAMVPGIPGSSVHATRYVIFPQEVQR